MADPYRLGLFGWGTVGGGVVRILQEEAPRLSARLGAALHLDAVVTRNPERSRGQRLGQTKLGSDPRLILDDPHIGTVMLLLGGTTDALDLVRASLRAGKHVVTANKAIIANHWDELHALAREYRVQLRYEAAVAGGIPVIAALRESFAGNRIDAVQGILNGTCNYILTMMEEKGWAYERALAEAQALGFAEADPTLDVDGTDTAHKLVILARLAFDAPVTLDQVSLRGIQRIGAAEIASARRLGCRIKLLGIAQRYGDGIALAAAPTLIPLDHPLAQVRHNYNAVNIEGHACGPMLLTGQGAGAMPTASAVLADVMALASGRAAWPRGEGRELESLRVITDNTEPVSFFARFVVNDKPGVLARICRGFGDYGVSILSIHQDVPPNTGVATIEVITHPASGVDFAQALTLIESAVEPIDATLVLERL